MSTSRHRSVTHTLTQMEKVHRHTNTQRSRTKESRVFESEKGRDEEITSCPLKIKKAGEEKRRQSRIKGKESLTMTTTLHLFIWSALLNRSLHAVTKLLLSSYFLIFNLLFSLKHNLILAKLIKCPYCCSFDPIDLVFG